VRFQRKEGKNVGSKKKKVFSLSEISFQHFKMRMDGVAFLLSTHSTKMKNFKLSMKERRADEERNRE